MKAVQPVETRHEHNLVVGRDINGSLVEFKHQVSFVNKKLEQLHSNYQQFAQRTKQQSTSHNSFFHVSKKDISLVQQNFAKYENKVTKYQNEVQKVVIHGERLLGFLEGITGNPAKHRRGQSTDSMEIRDNHLGNERGEEDAWLLEIIEKKPRSVIRQEKNSNEPQKDAKITGKVDVSSNASSNQLDDILLQCCTTTALSEGALENLFGYANTLWKNVQRIDVSKKQPMLKEYVLGVNKHLLRYSDYDKELRKIVTEMKQSSEQWRQRLLETDNCVITGLSTSDISQKGETSLVKRVWQGIKGRMDKHQLSSDVRYTSLESGISPSEWGSSVSNNVIEVAQDDRSLTHSEEYDVLSARYHTEWNNTTAVLGDLVERVSQSSHIMSSPLKAAKLEEIKHRFNQLTQPKSADVPKKLDDTVSSIQSVEQPSADSVLAGNQESVIENDVVHTQQPPSAGLTEIFATRTNILDQIAQNMSALPLNNANLVTSNAMANPLIIDSHLSLKDTIHIHKRAPEPYTLARLCTQFYQQVEQCCQKFL